MTARQWAGAALAFGTALAAPAWADPQENARFAPLQVESAVPLGLGKLEAEFSSRYVRDRYNERGQDLLVMEPLLRLGAFPGGHVTIGVPYRVGNQGTANQGAGSLGVLYNFNDQTAYLPAFGVAVTYETPFGAGHKTAEYLVRGLASKSLGSSPSSPRLHLNVGYTRLTQPGKAEREDRLEFVAGGSVLLRDDLALFLDVVHGAKAERRQTQTLVEAALRYEIGGDWYVSGGVGVGVGAQSPAFRALFTLQRGFKLF